MAKKHIFVEVLTACMPDGDKMESIVWNALVRCMVRVTSLDHCNVLHVFTTQISGVMSGSESMS